MEPGMNPVASKRPATASSTQKQPSVDWSTGRSSMATQQRGGMEERLLPVAVCAIKVTSQFGQHGVGGGDK